MADAEPARTPLRCGGGIIRRCRRGSEVYMDMVMERHARARVPCRVHGTQDTAALKPLTPRPPQRRSHIHRISTDRRAY